MPRTYVALDLETTGLDAQRDAIMEIGAVRFDLEGGCETFSTFVDPKQAIPYRIQRLTNISDGDVAGAPQFAEVTAELQAFIGPHPVVGQNVSFDLAFLEMNRLTPPGPAYDTHELASLLLPELIERNLRGIARHLGIDFPVRHRALADAQAARSVFLALRERLAALPATLIEEAERIASMTDWPLRHLLREVLEELPVIEAEETPGLVHGVVRAPAPYGAAPTANGEPTPVDADAIERLLTVDAAEVIDGFEERPEQVAMARAVTDTLNHGGQLLVEAGTGTGKSLAYLLPAARYAVDNGARVVISTNTINLQEQLIGQDIPAVERLLGSECELNAAQLKGRRNYLCLLRWSNTRRSANLSVDEARLLVRLLLWLPQTETGDRAEVRLSRYEELLWGRWSAQHESCLATPCAFVKDGSCFLLRARKRAEAAHVLVVNHALLLSDLAVGGGVIPDYDHLIIDEAQHLEEEATSQFGFHATEEEIGALLDRVAGAGGLVPSVQNAARNRLAAVELLEAAAQAQDAADRARERLPEFFLRIAAFLRQQAPGENAYETRLRLTHAMRVQPDWADVELAWENLSATLSELGTSLDNLGTALQAVEAESLLDRETLLSEASDLHQDAGTLRQGMADIVLRDDPATICWISESRSAEGASLSSAPLRVSELLEERLFSQKQSTVLTSATLTTEDQFDYLRSTLGLADANELLLGSPFDYAKSTLVLVPRDMPEPNQSSYMPALQQALIELVRASRGRALALFTSHASLRAAYDGIKRPLEDDEILVLGHQIDGSPRSLIESLREQPQTLVLGAASFWEGVDVVGEALSLLIIARLPFSVPNDPIFQARSELYDDAFSQYAVPQAVLRFKQGFGRLIRRKTDRGVLVVLDGRLHTRSYGSAFLGSLPPCTFERAPLREMPQKISEWLGEGA